MNFLTVRNTAERGEIFIFGDIVDDSWNCGWEDDPAVYPLDIVQMLKGFSGQPVDVHINSGGGHAFAGAAIANVLRQYSGETTAYIDGVAASAAATVAFGCDRIVIPSNAYLMIHQPTAAAWGSATDLRKAAEMLDAVQKGIVNLYLSKAAKGVDESTVNALVDAETWLTGKDAAQYFAVELVKEINALNRIGDVYNKYTNIPERLKINNQTLKQRQEIEIALALN